MSDTQKPLGLPSPEGNGDPSPEERANQRKITPLKNTEP